MLDLFAPLGYDIVVLCFVWFIARNLIHFWCMQNADNWELWDGMFYFSTDDVFEEC